MTKNHLASITAVFSIILGAFAAFYAMISIVMATANGMAFWVATLLFSGVWMLLPVFILVGALYALKVNSNKIIGAALCMFLMPLMACSIMQMLSASQNHAPISEAQNSLKNEQMQAAELTEDMHRKIEEQRFMLEKMSQQTSITFTPPPLPPMLHPQQQGDSQ